MLPPSRVSAPVKLGQRCSCTRFNVLSPSREARRVPTHQGRGQRLLRSHLPLFLDMRVLFLDLIFCVLCFTVKDSIKGL